MPMLKLETMWCEVDGALARFRLHRPEALNAANRVWVEDFVTITDYLAQRPEVHVVIVSGDGRAFCSGLDVKELAQGELLPEWFATWERGMLALEGLSAITLAAIHGYCLGGGLQVALACDLRVAAEDAVLSIPAVREGVVAALGPARLARLLGAGPAKRLCLLGHRFSAAEGARLGLIDEVVAPDALEERTLALAQELLAIPFTALMYTKRQIAAAVQPPLASALDDMVAAQAECLHSPEHLRVMDAYREAQMRRQQERATEQGR